MLTENDRIELNYSKTINESLAISVNRLWKAVQDGVYDAREIVGDETLLMAGILKNVGLGPLATEPTDIETLQFELKDDGKNDFFLYDVLICDRKVGRICRCKNKCLFDSYALAPSLSPNELRRIANFMEKIDCSRKENSNEQS